jgi:hypothetical protein
LQGRSNLHPVDMRRDECGQLLREHRGWLWRDAFLQRDLPQDRMGVQSGIVPGRAHRRLRPAGVHHHSRGSVLWRHRRWMRINCTLRNHLRQAWMDLPEQPVQGRSDRWLHAPDLHGKQWRPVLRGHRRRLRQLARLRHHLHQARVDLSEQSLCRPAWCVHAPHLRNREW